MIVKSTSANDRQSSKAKQAKPNGENRNEPGRYRERAINLSLLSVSGQGEVSRVKSNEVCKKKSTKNYFLNPSSTYSLL